MKFGVGQSVRRTEDIRFITGQGQYTDDLRFPGEAFVAYGEAVRYRSAGPKAAADLGAAAAQASVKASELGMNGKVTTARDLWAHQDVSFSGGTYSASVPSHGVLLLKVSGK